MRDVHEIKNDPFKKTSAPTQEIDTHNMDEGTSTEMNERFSNLRKEMLKLKQELQKAMRDLEVKMNQKVDHTLMNELEGNNTFKYEE
jgi:uncharacterized protein YdcH (DUF465 family)